MTKQSGTRDISITIDAHFNFNRNKKSLECSHGNKKSIEN